MTARPAGHDNTGMQDTHDSDQEPLSERYASQEMLQSVSANPRYRSWRRQWIALAEAEAELGLGITPAQIEEMRRRRLVGRSASLGRSLLESLSRVKSTQSLEISVRGIGLMAGLELRFREGPPATCQTLGTIKEMLRRGYILLPEGGFANVVSFTPPLTISADQCDEAVTVLASIVRRL